MSGLRERVEALAARWDEEIATFLRIIAPMRNAQIVDASARTWMACRAELLAAIEADDATADEPTALAGYMVAPDARGEQAIWRTDDELFPTVAITQTWLDPALWDVLVNAIEGGQS